MSRLSADPRLQRASPWSQRSAEAAEDQAAGDHGQYDGQHLQGVGGDVDRAAAAPGLGHAGGVFLDDRPAGAEQPGYGRDQGEQHQRHHRDGDQHPQCDHGAGSGFEQPVVGVVPAVGQQSEQGGADPVVEVGDPGQVGEQVVAVEAQQRQQLLHHLQGLGRDQQQQGVPPGGVPPAEGEHHDQGVEVQAAQVGADPAAASEPVAVGDVGVEGGPHQVQAGSHDAGFGAAVAGGRGVAELVEPAGEHGHREHQQQQLGTLEGVVGGRGQALLEEHPPGHRQEGEGHDRHQDRAEQEPERVGEPVGGARVGDGELELEPQQRVGPLQRRVGAVGEPDQSQGAQVLIDQPGDHLGGDAPAHRPADAVRDLGAGALPVDRLQHPVEQGGELQRLAVAAAHQGRWGPVAGPHHLPEELDAVDTRRRVDEGGH